MLKPFLLLSFSTLLFFSSCAKKTTPPPTETSSQTERLMKGTWILTNYEVQNIDEKHVDITLFRVIDKSCLKGSQWTFVPNNATGVYRLNGINCNGQYFFKWNVVKKGDIEYFQFKYQTDQIKDKDISVGEAQLNVFSITEDEILMKQDITFENKQIHIIYTFNKQQ